MTTTHKRLSVPLTPQDQADLELLRTSPEAAKHAGIDDVSVSDASLVHALLRQRLDFVAEQVLSIGYEQLAQDAELQEHFAAIRGRRRGGSD
jgi:hypothetical protein